MAGLVWERLRTPLMVAAVLVISMLQSAPPIGAAAAAPTCGTTTTVNYTIQVCLTAPAAGATVTGNTSVTATASLAHPQVRDLLFTLDGGYLLTDFQSAPYSFTWPTAQWVDGAHTLRVSALMFDNTMTTPVTESVSLSNGVTTPPVNTNKPTITPGTTPSPGSPLIVGTVGDGAGGEPTADQVVGLVASWLPNLFLYLGDVYQNGSYTEFLNWYQPSFGSLRSITDPTVGNHEYLIPKAVGYFNYWNNEPSYYSFDSAGWHFISLNSNAGKLGSGAFSNEVTWLNNDLSTHRGACIVAFWHHPLFNIGHEGQSTAIQPLWTALANARATMVLTGHDHTYQRWQPLDAAGNVSASGITEFVAGTGGHAVLSTSFVRTDPRTAATLSGTAGALQLAFSQTSAAFKFIGSQSGTVIDSGTVPCQGYGTVTGTVSDAGSGKPISGATVSYTGGSVITDSLGHYTLTPVTVGTYTVTAGATGYANQSQSVVVGGAATITQNFGLATPNAGAITGAVRDSATNQPINGAVVSFTGGSASTNSSGVYTFSNVAPGSYVLTASAGGYTTQQSQPVIVTSGSTTTQNFALAPLPGTITGTVTDASTQKPVSAATVSYSGGSAVTDGLGNYTLSNVVEGTYSVTATAANYTTSAPVSVPVGPGATVTQNFSLGPLPGSISGTVTDSTTAKAIAAATVAYSGGSTTTDAAGAYTLTGVPEGTYSVTASATNYGSLSQTVAVGAGQSVTQNFSLPPGPGLISGTITDGRTAQPIAAAVVSYSGGSTTTNGSGGYTLSVAPGSYVLTASAGGYTSEQSQPLTVTSGSTTTQNFALVPLPGTITGTVTDASTHKPVSAATVSYSGGSAVTDGLGNYTLSNVAEGTYSVTATAANYTTSAPVSVPVGPGATVTQNFSLGPLPGSISGTVTDSTTAKAIAAATVAYSGGSTTTDAAGAYTLTGVPEGTYSVTASATNYLSLSQTVVVGPGASVTQNFALVPVASTQVFSDGFESGNLSAWTTSTGLTVESTTVHSGTHAAEGNPTTGAAYARKTLSATYSDLYYRIYFDLKSQGANTVSLLGLRTAASSPLVRLYVDTSGHLGMRNEVAGNTASGPAVTLGTWHALELHVIINGTSSTTEVWLDGTAVSAFSNSAANLGTTLVGMLQLGEPTSARTYDVVFDDVVAGTSRIGL